MLEYESQIPAGVADGAPAVVLLHGRGSDERDLLALAPSLPPGVMTITPRAPFSGADWGYGPGWAWYRFLGEDRPEPETFEAGQRALHEFLSELPEALPVRPGSIVLGGFSQGGTMSLGYALRNPGKLSTVLIFSGFLAAHPSVVATKETVADTRFFWGHGTRDQSVPFSIAARGREALRLAGADLEARDYPIGHWIAREELGDAVQWMGVEAGSTRSGTSGLEVNRRGS